jgi:hypothetical protein
VEREHTVRWLAFQFVRQWLDLGTAKINGPRPFFAHPDEELRSMLGDTFESFFVDGDEDVAMSTLLTEAYVYCCEWRMEDAVRDEIAARKIESHHEAMTRARARKARATTVAVEADTGHKMEAVVKAEASDTVSGQLNPVDLLDLIARQTAGA